MRRRVAKIIVVNHELSVAHEKSLTARLSACLKCSIVMLKMGSTGTSGLPAFEFI